MRLALHLYVDKRFPLPARLRFMDKPVIEEQPLRGRFQHRERVIYAGNKADGERVFHQSAYQILVQEKGMGRLDKHSKPIPSKYDFRHARFG